MFLEYWRGLELIGFLLIASMETLTVQSCFSFLVPGLLTNVADGAMHEAVPAIADAGVSPIVRPPGMEGWMIKSQYSSSDDKQES
jgi:hypothetical protein